MKREWLRGATLYSRRYLRSQGPCGTPASLPVGFDVVGALYVQKRQRILLDSRVDFFVSTSASSIVLFIMIAAADVHIEGWT